MIHPLTAAVLAAALVFPASAMAQSSVQGAKPETVAGAFIAAAQSQDRQAALKLLDEQVQIAFPSRSAAGRQGHAEGQPFVIGYLDGLFDARRGISLDGGAAPRDGAVRFLAHDDANDRYAIDVEVQGARVVRVTVNLQADETVAALGS